MDWYFGVWRKYVTFDGRARRQEFWMFVLINLAVGIVLSVIDSILGTRSGGSGLLGGLYDLAVFLPSLAVSMRRLHDTDRSGWWLLLSLVPIVGWIILIVFYALDGTHGPNRYGPDPKAGDAAWPAAASYPGAPGAPGYYGAPPAPAPPGPAPAPPASAGGPLATGYQGASSEPASAGGYGALGVPDAPAAPDAPASFGDTAQADSTVSTPQSLAPGPSTTAPTVAPQATATPVAPAGWYADPGGRHQYRYWDAAQWTAHVSDNGAASVDPA